MDLVSGGDLLHRPPPPPHSATRFLSLTGLMHPLILQASDHAENLSTHPLLHEHVSLGGPRLLHLAATTSERQVEQSPPGHVSWTSV